MSKTKEEKTVVKQEQPDVASPVGKELADNSDKSTADKPTKKKGSRKLKFNASEKFKFVCIALFLIIFGYIGSMSDGKVSEIFDPFVYGEAKNIYTFNDWLNLVMLVTACLFSIFVVGKYVKKNKTDSKVENKPIEQPNDETENKSTEQPNKQSNENEVNSVEKVIERYSDDVPKDVQSKETKQHTVQDATQSNDFNSLGIDFDDLLSEFDSSTNNAQPNDKLKTAEDISGLNPFG